MNFTNLSQPVVKRSLRCAITLIVVATLGACGEDSPEVCALAPCPLPQALSVTVSSTVVPGAVPGAFVQVASWSSPMPCNQGSAGATCLVMGSAGEYVVDIGAPGYQTVRRTVLVQGRTVGCSCPTVVTQQLSVALTPAP